MRRLGKSQLTIFITYYSNVYTTRSKCGTSEIAYLIPSALASITLREKGEEISQFRLLLTFKSMSGKKI
jgi:hypothetical protein